MFNSVTGANLVEKVEETLLNPAVESISIEILKDNQTPDPISCRALAPKFAQIREDLQQKGILGEDGILTKQIGALPVVKNLERFFSVLNKTINIIGSLEQPFASIPHSELIKLVEKVCLSEFKNIQVLLRGSTAAYASGMEDCLLNALLEFECGDLVELAKELDPIHESDDLDWLFKVLPKSDNESIDIKALFSLKNKLISLIQEITSLSYEEVSSHAFINLCIPRKKDSKGKITLAESFLISSLGDRNSLKTDLVIGIPKRDHLFVQDDWAIEVDPSHLFSEKEIAIIPKTSAENPYQPVFDKLLKMLHIDNPRTVNTEGLMTIPLYLSKGASYFPSKFPLLKKLCLKGKNITKLSRLLKRRLANHSANPIAVTFNTSVLKARINLKKEKRLPKGLVKEDFDFKLFWEEMSSDFPKNGSFFNLIADAMKHQCSFEHIWAVIHHAACFRLNEASSLLENDTGVQVYRIFEPRGPKIQIHINGDYLVFPLDVAGATHSLQSVSQKDLPFLMKIWSSLVPQNFNPALEPSPLLRDIDKIPDFPATLQESYIQLLSQKVPFLKQIGFYLASSSTSFGLPIADKAIFIENMFEILQTATTYQQRQILFDLFCRWEQLVPVTFQPTDKPEKICHRWILSLCQSSYFDHQGQKLWKDLKGKLSKENLNQYTFELIQSLSVRPEKGYLLLKNSLRSLTYQQQILAFESVCKGYQKQSVKQDAATLQNLRNLLISFSDKREKIELSSEIFKWLIQGTQEQETALTTLDFLSKLRDKSLYSYTGICNVASTICVEMLNEKQFDKALVALQKVYPWLSPSSRLFCLDYFMGHSENFQQKNFLEFLSQNPSAETSELRERYYIRVIEQAVNTQDVPSALSYLKYGEQCISAEMGQSLKIKIFKLMIELDRHDEILKSVQDKQSVSFQNEAFIPLWMEYFKSLICNPFDTNALWKMQRSQVIVGQTLLSSQLKDLDYIAWIEFFKQIPKPTEERTFKGLTSYESMLLELVSKTFKVAADSSQELIFKLTELIPVLESNEELFCSKLRAIVSPNFIILLKRLEENPEQLLRFLHLSNCIQLPLDQNQVCAALDAFSPILQTPAKEDEVIKRNTVLKFLVTSPASLTQKNALPALKACLLHIAQLDETNQIKWTNQIIQLIAKTKNEDRQEIYNILINHSTLLLDQSKFEAVFAFLKLTFCTQVKNFSSSSSLLMQLLQKKYGRNSLECISFLRKNSSLLKKHTFTNEFREFLARLFVDAHRDALTPTDVHELLLFIQNYEIEISPSDWKSLIEKTISEPKSQSFALLSKLWEKFSKQLNQSLERDICWKLLIACYLKENDQKKHIEILDLLISKQIIFSNSEIKYSVYENVIEVFSSHFKLTIELASKVALLRGELISGNIDGRYDQTLSFSLKKLLVFPEIPDLYDEAIPFIESNIQNEEAKDIFSICLRQFPLLTEHNQDKYKHRIIEIIKLALDKEVICPSLIFESLAHNRDPFFFLVTLETLIKIQEKSKSSLNMDRLIDQNYQGMVRNFLEIILKTNEISFELLEKSNTFFESEPSNLLSPEGFQDLLSLFLNESVNLITSTDLTPISWLKSQIGKVSLENRSTINQVFIKAYHFKFHQNLDFFKKLIIDYIALFSGDDHNTLVANLDFLIVTNRYIQQFFVDETRDEYFVFLKEIFTNTMINIQAYPSPAVFTVLNYLFPNLISYHEDRVVARELLEIAKQHGLFEQFDWGLHYRGAYTLLVKELDDIDENNLLNYLRSPKTDFSNNDYMSMCLMATQTLKKALFRTSYSMTLAIKILRAALPLLESPFLKTVYIDEYFKLQLCLEQIKIPNLSQSLCIKTFNFIELWGTNFLHIAESIQDLMDAENVGEFIKDDSETKFKEIISYNPDMMSRHVGSETNPFRIYFPKNLFYYATTLSITLSKRLKSLDPTADDGSIDQFLVSFTINAIEKKLFSKATPFLLEMLEVNIFPFLGTRFKPDFKNIENDPALKIMIALSKTKKLQAQRVNALRAWLKCLAEKKESGIGKYCLALLERFKEEGYYEKSQQSYIKLLHFFRNI